MLHGAARALGKPRLPSDTCFTGLLPREHDDFQCPGDTLILFTSLLASIALACSLCTKSLKLSLYNCKLNMLFAIFFRPAYLAPHPGNLITEAYRVPDTRTSQGSGTIQRCLTLRTEQQGPRDMHDTRNGSTRNASSNGALNFAHKTCERVRSASGVKGVHQRGVRGQREGGLSFQTQIPSFPCLADHPCFASLSFSVGWTEQLGRQSDRLSSFS